MKTRYLPVLFLLAGALAFAAPASGKKLLFVVQLKAAPEIVETDGKVREHLQALGFSVTTIDQREDAAAANGNDLVLISSSVSGHVIEGKYKATPTAVVTWEAYALPHMGLTGKKEE